MEVFTGKQMGNSNIILLGSANQMSRTGSSGHVFNWLACVEKITLQWPNVKVCPLVPIWSESVSGKLVRTGRSSALSFSPSLSMIRVVLATRGQFSQGNWLKQLSCQMSRIPNLFRTLCHSQLVCQVPLKSRVGPLTHPWRHS